MLCGRCCVTEPPLRPALRLDIFIEILLLCRWVNKAHRSRTQWASTTETIAGI